MGNRRSVEKALEHVGADATLTRDRDQIARRRRARACPGVGAFPRGDGEPARAPASTGDRRAPRGDGTPLLGICLGMQLLFERSDELERHRRPRADRRRGHARCGSGAAAGSAHRLERGAFERALAADRRPAAGRAGLLPRALLRGAPARRARTWSAPPSTASASRRSSPGQRLRHAVSSREVLGARAARCCATSSGCATAPGGRRVRRAGRAHDPAAGDRHPRRQARAAGARRLRPADRLRRRSARRRAALGRAGARALHVVDLDGARTGAPANLEHVGRIAAGGRRAGAGRRRAARGRVGRRGARRPAPRGWCSGRPRCATSSSSTRRSPTTATASTVSVDARGGQLAAAGWTEQTEIPAERGDREPRHAAACAVRLLEHRARRDAERPRPRRGAGGSPRSSAARFVYSGGVSSLDGPARAGGAAPGQPDRRDRRQGAVRAALRRRRGQAVLDGAPVRPTPGLRVRADALQARDPVPRRRLAAASSRASGSSTCATPATRSSSPPATTAPAPTSSCSSTSPRPRTSAARSSSWPGAPPTRCSSRSRSAAGSARSPTPRRCSTPAPTRSRSTRRRCSARS